VTKAIKFILGILLAMPSTVIASGGLVGDCVDCHTMHNSEKGTPVAVLGTSYISPGMPVNSRILGIAHTITSTPIENLLRMDCIACHVIDPGGGDKIVDMGGGSQIPQIWHADASGDLAAGNFRYIADGGNKIYGRGQSKKGHNVADLFAGGDVNGGTYGVPPGKYRQSTHGPVFSDTTPFDKFTCAGSGGCHGTRSQLFSGTINDNDTTDTGDDFFVGEQRRGLTAIRGAHHANYDGLKDSIGYISPQVHDGQIVADGYRFIPGLKGYGNETARWQNVSPTSHNEYYGKSGGLLISGCETCHIQGSEAGMSPYLSLDSVLIVPNNSMSGFCTTCHGSFHSAADGNYLMAEGSGSNNGVSGSFLRHPSDYLIPQKGEYSAYTSLTLSALVARPDLTGFDGTDDTVNPGTDLVMCLSCHLAHASEHDAMLRFDYDGQTAGTATDGLGIGCLACHTTKGILPQNR